MNRYQRVPVVLAWTSVAWCTAMVVAISRTPLWHQGAVQGAVLVPIAVALLATWAASRRNRVGIWGSAILMVAFSFVTGFSIGNAYVPASGMLIVASLAAVPRHASGQRQDAVNMACSRRPGGRIMGRG